MECPVTELLFCLTFENLMSCLSINLTISPYVLLNITSMSVVPGDEQHIRNQSRSDLSINNTGYTGLTWAKLNFPYNFRYRFSLNTWCRWALNIWTDVTTTFYIFFMYWMQGMHTNKFQWIVCNSHPRNSLWSRHPRYYVYTVSFAAQKSAECGTYKASPSTWKPDNSWVS